MASFLSESPATKTRTALRNVASAFAMTSTIVLKKIDQLKWLQFQLKPNILVYVDARSEYNLLNRLGGAIELGRCIYMHRLFI
jgi:hypothetical protein